MLEISGLIVEYGARRVLDGVSLSLGGELGKMVVVGPNGSGKSTLIRAALGLAPIRGGSVRIFGDDVRSLRGETRVSANLTELYGLMQVDVGELIQIFAELKGLPPERFFGLLSQFGLDDIVHKKWYQLSTGQAKMFGNIMVLGSQCELAFLDEPFESVDQGRRIRLAEMLGAMDAEVLLVTHEFNLLRRLGDWGLGFMFEGKLYSGFRVADLEELYVSRCERGASRAVVDTALGCFSITRGSGDVPLKNISDLNRLFEEVA
jgi:ABC-type multidrug transport system ATPase subunit